MTLRFGKIRWNKVILGLTMIAGTVAAAQTSSTNSASSPVKWPKPVMDNQIFAHVLMDQLEGRTLSGRPQFRWDGEGWAGNDWNRLWIKSEGFADATGVSDGDHEFLYDRPIPRMRYFDMQAGLRADLDSGPSRAWAAVGIEGLAPYSFEFAPTFYFRNDGRVAGRIEGQYQLRLSQRLIAEPQAELNFYSKDDPERETGTGLSDLDGGLRLRYEVRRKFAPYIGYTYDGSYGNSAMYRRASGERSNKNSFVFGIRVWH